MSKPVKFDYSRPLSEPQTCTAVRSDGFVSLGWIIAAQENLDKHEDNKGVSREKPSLHSTLFPDEAAEFLQVKIQKSTCGEEGGGGAGEGEGGERGEADVNTSLLEFLGQSLTPALSLFFFFFSCRIQQPVRSSEGFVGFMIKCEKMSLLVCVSMLVQLVGCSLWPYGLIARSLSLSFDLCVCGLVMWRRRRWCNELHIQPPPPLSNTR